MFQNVSQKIGDRPGGYTRIIKTGHRLGDNAAMCFIELVDYNENMLKDSTTAKKTTTRRSRRKSTADANTLSVSNVTETKETKKIDVSEDVKVEEKKADLEQEVLDDEPKNDNE